MSRIEDLFDASIEQTRQRGGCPSMRNLETAKVLTAMFMGDFSILLYELKHVENLPLTVLRAMKRAEESQDRLRDLRKP